jgi:hypothetical protein
MTRIRAFLKIVAALLRELSDERAYERHLAWHGRTHSKAEWQHFQEHRSRARFSNPKCC